MKRKLVFISIASLLLVGCIVVPTRRGAVIEPIPPPVLVAPVPPPIIIAPVPPPPPFR